MFAATSPEPLLLLIQFIIQNTSTQNGLRHERRRIDGIHSRGRAIAQERLRTVVEDMVLIAKGENELLHLAGLAIEGQHIVTGSASVVNQAGRAVEEGPDEYLPVLRPTLRRVLLGNKQGRAKGIEGAALSHRVEKHDAQRREAKMPDVEYLSREQTGVIHLHFQGKIRSEGQKLRIARARIVEQHLGATGAVKVARVNIPVPVETVQYLIMVHLQFAAKIHDTCLASRAVIEEDTILVGVIKTANVDLPGIVHQGILLLLLDAEVAFETDQHDIGCQSYALRINARAPA